jgi:hypothetical protein
MPRKTERKTWRGKTLCDWQNVVLLKLYENLGEKTPGDKGIEALRAA